jgi:hypothetical protein
MELACLGVSRSSRMLDIATARDLIDLASGFSQDYFERNGKVLPVWLAINDADQFIITPQGGGKDVTNDAVRDFFARQEITAYVFFDEAWYLDTKADSISEDEMRKAYKKGLRDHPLRREGVMFSAEDHDGQVMGRRTIIRKTNSRARLGPLEIFPHGAMEGRMVGMLPPPKGRSYN